MPEATCLICESTFYTKPSHQKRGWGKYCSTSCRTKAQFKGKTVSCFICKKEIYRSQKDLKNSKSEKYFCTKTCQTIWRNTILFSGEGSPNWKHGKSAYRKILTRTGREQICALCKTNDKRVLIVHHKDRNRKNNKTDNLIWLCHNCHYLVHHFTTEQIKLKKEENNMVAVVHQ